MSRQYSGEISWLNGKRYIANVEDLAQKGADDMDDALMVIEMYYTYCSTAAEIFLLRFLSGYRLNTYTGAGHCVAKPP